MDTDTVMLSKVVLYCLVSVKIKMKFLIIM